MRNRSIFSLLLTVLNLSSSLENVSSPPSIVKQPPSTQLFFQVAGHGDPNIPFFLECEATGEPTPKYRWTKNGKPFIWQVYDDRITQQPDHGTLSFAKPQEIDQGQYQCFAENVNGIATSNSVFVRQATLDSFKTQETITMVGNEGEPFRLICQPPEGYPKPILHWIYVYSNGGIRSINSSRITVDPEGTLWFSSLTKSDASNHFEYACAASSTFLKEYRVGNRIVLNVTSNSSVSENKLEPVSQYLSRRNTVSYLGENQKLYCIYGGTPLPQIVWYKDGKFINSSDRVFPADFGKSLVIKAVKFEDEGTYTCEVSNGVKEAKSYSINNKVYAVPYFIEEPENINATEDETVEFRCKVAGVPEPEIKWIFNGKLVEEASPNPRRRVETNRIVIQRLTIGDSGNYGCNASSSLGYVYKDVYVNVFPILAVSPEFIETVKEVEALVGQNVTISCKTTGLPKPSVKWFLNDGQLKKGRHEVQQTGDLLIIDVQVEDRGDYTCFAENTLGTASQSVKLKVKTGEEEINVADGERENLKI